MMRLRVRFLRSRSSWPVGRPGSGRDGHGAPGGRRDGLGRPDRGQHGGDAGVARLDRSTVREPEQVRPQLLGRAVAVVRVLGHRLHDDGLERRRHRRVHLPGKGRHVAHMFRGHGDGRVAGEGRAPDGHLVEHHSEGVDVAARVHPLALGLLGREVGGRAHDGAGLSQALLGVHGPGDAEVRDLDVPLRGDQDVARLHVAVDHPVPVREGERGGHAGTDGGDLARRHALGIAQDGGERPALDVLHDDEVGAVVLPPVEDRDDVGVGQVGGGLGFPAEALDEGAVDGELREEHLERHRSLELAVHGAVDLRHPAAGDQVGQLVATGVHPRRLDRFHGALSLRWEPSPTGNGRVRHGAAVVAVTGTVVVVSGTVVEVVVAGRRRGRAVVARSASWSWSSWSWS